MADPPSDCPCPIILWQATQQQLEVAREAYLLKMVTDKLRSASTCLAASHPSLFLVALLKTAVRVSPSSTVEKRDVPTLEAAIAAALEVRLQSPLVTQARQLLALLQAQLAAAAALQDAMAARDIGLLDAALSQCEKVGLVTEAVGQAQALRTQLKAQAAASTYLCGFKPPPSRRRAAAERAAFESRCRQAPR